MEKQCKSCSANFEDSTKNHNRLYCCAMCKIKDYRLQNWEKVRLIEKRYGSSIKGRLRDQKYAKTERAKINRKKYNQSKKGRVRTKKFQSSEKWKNYAKNYEASENRKLYKKMYRRSETGKVVMKKAARKFVTLHPEKVKEYQRKYRQSEKGKMRKNKYPQLDDGITRDSIICPCGKLFPKSIYNRKYCSKRCNNIAKSRSSPRKEYLQRWWKNGGKEYHNSYYKNYNQLPERKEYRKKYNASERAILSRKLYIQSNPVNMRRYAEKFRRSEKGKALNRKQARARRARTREVHEHFTQLMEKAVREAFENKCFITGITNEEHLKKYKKALHLDHVDPLYHNHALSFDNVCLVSLPENARKGSRIGWYSEDQLKKIKSLQVTAKKIYEEKYKHLEKTIH